VELWSKKKETRRDSPTARRGKSGEKKEKKRTRAFTWEGGKKKKKLAPLAEMFKKKGEPRSRLLPGKEVFDLIIEVVQERKGRTGYETPRGAGRQQERGEGAERIITFTNRPQKKGKGKETHEERGRGEGKEGAGEILFSSLQIRG